MCDVEAKPLINEIATFLDATATALRDTVMRFERTTARITESVTTRPSLADRDLIVTLQDFDRLQQEFATLADVLGRAAAKSSESWRRIEGGGHPAQDALATITIADMKERLMQNLGLSAIDLAIGSAADEVVF
jgi:hypothetical protein